MFLNDWCTSIVPKNRSYCLKEKVYIFRYLSPNIAEDKMLWVKFTNLTKMCGTVLATCSIPVPSLCFLSPVYLQLSWPQIKESPSMIWSLLGGWSLSKLTLGEGHAAAWWAGCKFIPGLKYRDKQPHALEITPLCNLFSLVRQHLLWCYDVISISFICVHVVVGYFFPVEFECFDQSLVSWWQGRTE